MTDNEIIKALECCFVESDCTECPLHKKYEKDCLKEAATKALDLINRQKAESDHLRQMLEAAIAGQETLQKETSKWVKECEELQERLIEYEGMDFGQDMGMQAPAQPGGTPQMPGAENLAGFGKEPANVEKARKRSQGASQPGGGKQ